MLLRPALPSDALSVARVHVRSWQAAYRGLIPDDYLDSLRPEDRAARYDFTHVDPAKPHTLVALDREVILGFATTMPSRDQDALDRGELAALYVDPDHWCQGLGVALIVAARAQLAASGFKHAILWVLAGNERAASFYRKDGWADDGARRTQLIWELHLDEQRYTRALL